MRQRDPWRVVALAYEGLHTFEFGVAVEVFGLPRPELDPWYTFQVCAPEPGAVSAIGGVRMQVDRGPGALDHAGTILIPGWRSAGPAPATLLRKLRRAHEAGARLVSICSGAFLLGEAGLPCSLACAHTGIHDLVVGGTRRGLGRDGQRAQQRHEAAQQGDSVEGSGHGLGRGGGRAAPEGCKQRAAWIGASNHFPLPHPGVGVFPERWTPFPPRPGGIFRSRHTPAPRALVGLAQTLHFGC